MCCEGQGAKNFGFLQRQGSKRFERVAKGSEKFWMRHQGGNFVDASPRREGFFRLNRSNIVEILPFNCGFTPLWGIKIDFTVLVAFQVLFSSSIRV